ncbi:MAG: hypothetical protein K6F20_06775, partial [Bacteroidaceae bacterium]|nr:hypothetical protein [Bacteroidaceae bacterium]
MKRSVYFISALILSLSLLLSCGGGGSEEGLLTRLDALVEADADSALVLMGRTPSEGWSRRDAMRLELLRAKAMNRADSLFTTDSLMLRVVKYYQRHGSRNDRMLSLYLLGCTYRDMGAAPRAIETWQRAVAEADTTASDCDLSTLMRIHSQMNGLYTRQRLPEYAQQEAELAEAICWKMKDTLNAMYFQQEVCKTLFNAGNYEKCITYALALYDQYLGIGQKNKAALVSVYCIKSYLELKDYAKAKHYLEIYESYCLSEKDHRKIDGGLAPYYIYKGRYYLGIGNVDSAEYCFRKAIPEMHLLHNDVAVYWGLQNVYNARHQADSVLKYAALYGQAKERSYASDIAQATVNAKNLYDYSVEQRKMQEERDKKRRLQDGLYFTIALALLIFYILYHHWYVKKKTQEEELNKLIIEMQKIQLENQEKENAIQHQNLLLQEDSHNLRAAQEMMDKLRGKMEAIEKEKEQSLVRIASLTEQLAQKDAAQVSTYELEQEKAHLLQMYHDEKTRADQLAQSEKQYQEQIAQLQQEKTQLEVQQQERTNRLNELTASYRNDQIEKSPIVKKFLCAVQENQV